MIESTRPTRSILDRLRAAWIARMSEPYRVTGIDISHHQGAFNWGLAIEAGHRFAWFKATEGVDHVDRQLTRNVEQARIGRGTIEAGPYHFATWDNADASDPAADAIAEAEFFVSTCERRNSAIWDPGYMSPMVDTELRTGRGHHMGYDQTMIWLHAHMRRIEQLTGRIPVWYASRWFIFGDPRTRSRGLGVENVPFFRKYPLFYPRYKGTTAPIDSIPGLQTQIWQYTGSGKLSGHEGRIDLNRFMGDRQEFAELLGGKMPGWLHALPGMVYA